MAEISVIVPVYNVEKYLHRCIDSILVQSFSGFELILVDDGSPDSCGEICDQYAKDDNRIVVIHQKNGGLSAARNAGIDWAFNNSNSKWITFIDSDDWVVSKYLEVLLNAVKTKKVDISVGLYQETHGKGWNEPTKYSSTIWNTKDFYMVNQVNSIVAVGKLYRKDCFKTIRFPIGKIHEDEFTTYKLLFMYKKIAVINEVVYAYFQNENGIMAKETSLIGYRGILDGIDAIREQIEFFYKKGFENIAKMSFGSLINYSIVSQDRILNSILLTRKMKKKCLDSIRRRMRNILKSSKKEGWRCIHSRKGYLLVYASAYRPIGFALRIWRAVKTKKN